jgi:hypothetical protein
MVDDDKPRLMHPAADVFLEQLLIHVDEENVGSVNAT